MFIALLRDNCKGFKFFIKNGIDVSYINNKIFVESSFFSNKIINLFVNNVDIIDKLDFLSIYNYFNMSLYYFNIYLAKMLIIIFGFQYRKSLCLRSYYQYHDYNFLQY